jgi:hypothetical protein
MRQVSAKRDAMSDARTVVRQVVFDRDRWCLLRNGLRPILAVAESAVVVPDCWGKPTPHHLRKAGQGGPYIECNLVRLCVGHNQWVETVRPWARLVGLEMTRTDTYADVWARLAAAGLVTYTWTGAAA